VTATLDDLLSRLERLLEEAERTEEPVRGMVFELLDGVDALHRAALKRLGRVLGPDEVTHLRDRDPAVAWLFDAYAVGVDEHAAAEAALESVRPYIASHGGRVEVVEVNEGVVRLRMAGECAGCSASAITLQEGIETALREGFPGFARVEVAEDDAPPHPPPGATLLQLMPRPD